MSFKKALLYACSGIAALGIHTAVAGGPDKIAKPGFNPYVYGELDLGYAYSDWRTFANNVATGLGAAGTNVSSNARGGFTIGGEIGYAPIRYVGVMFGGFYLPRITSNNGRAISNWFLYAGPRIMAPIWNGISLYAEGGVGYRSVSGSSGAPNGDYWTPVYGAGIQYDINDNFYLTAKWWRVPGQTNTNITGDRAPSADLYLAGGGYKFMI